MKKIDWKIISIVVIVLVVGLLIFKYISTTSSKNSNNHELVNDIDENLNLQAFFFNGILYVVPKGLKYENIDNTLTITSDNSWNAKVYMISKELTKYKTNDLLYEHYRELEDSEGYKLSRININDLDVVVFDYLNEKKYIYSFITDITDNDICFTIEVNYETEEFDVNVLSDVFNSLKNSEVVEYEVEE